MFAFDVLNSLLGTIIAMHPPVPVVDPLPGPEPSAPGLADEELGRLGEATDETIEVTSDAPSESASSVQLDKTKPEPLEQMHYTPGMPLTATLKAAYKF